MDKHPRDTAAKIQSLHAVPSLEISCIENANESDGATSRALRKRQEAWAAHEWATQQ